MRAGALQRYWRAVRGRAFADTLLIGLPLVLAVAIVAWRLVGMEAAVTAGVVTAALACAIAAWRASCFDARWLQRRLDALHPGMEDSADLLLVDGARLAPLQRLQRARLHERLRAAPDLRPSWSTRSIFIAFTFALLCALAALFWPAREATQSVSRSGAPEAHTDLAPRLVGQRLQITPPAYTGLVAQDSDALDARAPQGSRLRWTLRFEPQPTRATLQFHDGTRIELQREGDDWIAAHVLERSTLYRVVHDGASMQDALPPLHRLDAVPDRPPQVRVLVPERSLSMMQRGQRDWAVAFEVSDDHGVAADAQLHITVTRGSGEQITFDRRSRNLSGRGDGARRRFDAGIDVAAFALAPGEDLIVQLEVHDNRMPRPQSARSPSLILRSPPEPVPDIAGLEGLARQVLPVYFRSQRQIIIDAEALLKQKPSLPAERFLERSDTLGIDQRLLRLRYGQFLGEESEGAPRPPPTHDAEEAPAPPSKPPLPIDDFGQEASTPVPASGMDEDAHEDEHHADDGHDHDSAGPDDGVFGRESDLLAEFGHTHDIPEAATLLDPKTREVLRSALREMWQSELNLRQGEPQRALPYAHRALELIKQVQQADRIYLARLGSELPPIDESRRLSGDRAGIGRRPLPSAATRTDDDVPARIWRELAAPSGDARDLEALDGWLRANGDRIADPLALIAAIDAFRNDPGCDECRDDLRGLLWAAMQRPPAAVPRREGIDASGARYLDSLGEPSP